MKLIILSLILAVSTGCTSTEQLHIYNPFPNKDLVLEKKNISCSNSSDTKIWYALYGSYVINTVNTKEIFPSPDYSYKIEQISTSGDKFISIFTGLFFSVSRHTLRVDTCELGKKQNESEKPARSQDIPTNDHKINELEKEVSFLKGKISGIESSFTMIYAPGGTEAKEQLSEYKRQEKFKNREDSNVSQNQDSNQSELNESSYLEESKEDGANVQNLTPAASAYSYFLFRINSADLSVSEKNKINKLRPLLKKPDAKVLIVGYADKTGQFKSNLNLSWRRALEVKKLMMRLGVKPSRIELSAAGETGTTPRGQFSETSRRVDVYLLGGNF